MKIRKLCAVFALNVLFGCSSYTPQNGDIIFQTSLSSQSRAIQLATGSPYSHMGIVYVNQGRTFVYEASSVVRLTPFDEWVEGGKGGSYVVRRLKGARKLLTPAVLAKMRKCGENFRGKPYDLYFEWSDERIYCSELVWKIYREALGIEIGDLQKLSDFDLSAVEVKKKLEERYGIDIPLDEVVISPGSMYNSDMLETVYKN